MGPSIDNGEPAIHTFDWRTLLQSDERERVINKITETLKKQQLPFSGPYGVNEHRKVASRFEDRVFSNAANLNDYLCKISVEMLSIETTVINAADSPTCVPTANDSRLLNSGHLMENNNNWRHPYREPAMYTGDWRTRFPPDARGKIVNKIMQTLEKHHFGEEGINELMEIASRLEESIFYSADNQTYYLRQISMKLLLVETASQNTGDWRTQQPPESRQKNVKKLMETLKRHVPYSGQEGIDELMRIAVSFEDLIFNTALNQVDYFSKIDLKMQTVEDGN